MSPAHGVAQVDLRRLRSADDLGDPALKLHLLRVRSRVRGASTRAVAFVLPQRHRREPPIASADGPKLSRFRIPDIDVTDVARVVSHLEPTQTIPPWNQGAQPRRIIVQREHADALRRKPPLRPGQERQHDPRRVVLETGKIPAVLRPFRRRRLQRLRILLQIVIDHGESHAPLEVGETQASAPLCGIAIAVRDGSTGRPRMHREYGIELPKQPFDHPALMDTTAIAVANADAIVLAAALESAPFELFRGVGDELPRPSEHRPAMLDAARRQPILLRTHRLREA